MAFEGLKKGSPKLKRDPDCYCHTCDREVHHLGIMSHRAAHRRKGETCKITFSTGETYTYKPRGREHEMTIPNHKPEKIENPILFASGYTLNLYCDHKNVNHSFGEFPRVFCSEFKAETFKEARSLGWKIRLDGTATCPKCLKELKNAK